MQFDPFDQARQINIRDLIENKYGIDVTLSGRILFASCPKAGEGDSKPSLAIYPDENKFHCYHCGDWGGTPVDFVMGAENMTPMQALRHLDKLYPMLGLISAEGKSRSELVARYYASTEKLCSEYQKTLHGNKRYLDWVQKSRGISTSAIKKFRLGVKLTGGIPRLAIPLIGNSGAVLGFATRQMSPKDPVGRYHMFNIRLDPKTGNILKKDESVENSIDVLLKGNFVYGLSSVKKNTVAVVEGQLDVVAGWELGVDNMVAVGTQRLSNAQAEQLSRFSSVTLIPDNGAFGSVYENAQTIRTVVPTMPIKVVDLSPWKDEVKDVNDMLVFTSENNDLGLFKILVDGAQLLEVWLYNQNVMPVEDNDARAIEELDRILGIASAPAARAKLVSLASERLGLPADLLMRG